MPVFQPLEYGQVIPLGPWDVLRVGRIGRWTEFYRYEKAQHAEPDDKQRREREIHQHLARIEEFRFLFWMIGMLIEWSCGPSFAK